MTLKATIAAAVLCSATMLAMPASAMPINNLAGALSGNIENVRWVCGPYRCWWRPGPSYYYGPRFYGGFYGPRFYGPGYYGRRWGGYRYW
jgi:hypothetical protein